MYLLCVFGGSLLKVETVAVHYVGFEMLVDYTAKLVSHCSTIWEAHHQGRIGCFGFGIVNSLSRCKQHKQRCGTLSASLRVADSLKAPPTHGQFGSLRWCWTDVLGQAATER